MAAAAGGARILTPLGALSAQGVRGQLVGREAAVVAPPL